MASLLDNSLFGAQEKNFKALSVFDGKVENCAQLLDAA